MRPDGRFWAVACVTMVLVRRVDDTEVTQVRIVITPEERRAWLAASDAAGLSADDDWDALVAKAAALGIEARGVIPIFADIHGEQHEKPHAYVITDHTPGEELGAGSIEEALRLVIGEALVKRGEAAR